MPLTEIKNTLQTRAAGLDVSIIVANGGRGPTIFNGGSKSVIVATARRAVKR